MIEAEDTGPSWRDLYAEEVDRQIGYIRTAQRMGQRWLHWRGRTFDPTRLTQREAVALARREAEVILNIAVNTKIAELRSKGLPLGGLVDEIGVAA